MPWEWHSSSGCHWLDCLSSGTLPCAALLCVAHAHVSFTIRSSRASRSRVPPSKGAQRKSFSLSLPRVALSLPRVALSLPHVALSLSLLSLLSSLPPAWRACREQADILAFIQRAVAGVASAGAPPAAAQHAGRDAGKGGSGGGGGGSRCLYISGVPGTGKVRGGGDTWQGSITGQNADPPTPP